MSIKIISVKVIGLCSKHQTKDMPTPTNKFGERIPDNEIMCIECEL